METSAAKMFAILKSFSIQRIIALLFGLLFVRWFVRGVIRVYFHPLSRFPGPKFSAFTRIPHIHAMFTGSLHRYVAHLHEQYGEVVRISPDELSFIGATAWRDINGYGSKTGPGSPPPKNFFKYGEDLNGVENLILMKDDAEHTRVRKIFSPAFSDRALIQQAPLFLKYTNQLIQILHDKIKENGGENNVDIVRMYNFTTFDIMGDLTFGESLHMLDTQQYDEWVAMIFASLKIGIRINSVTQNYWILMSMMKFALKKFLWKIAQKHLDHSATRVTKRIEKGRSSEGVDIWDLVLSQEDQGKEGLGRLQMDSNASLFMLAGTETTATLLSGLTYLLLKNPETMEKLKKEVRTAFASSEDISMDEIARLPYLNVCIKEGLRCYPPVPVGMPHLTPSDGSTICGQFVPPGITVAVHHMSVYNSPTHFKDPLSFVPERWSGDERYANDERSVVQPFSVGPRDCIGKNMAYHEMRLILAKVIYHFDFELCPESEGWEDQDAYTLWEKKPLMVKLKVAGS